MAYKYAFIVNTLEIKAPLADATSDELSQHLAIALGNLAESLTKAVPELPGSQYQIVSHCLTRIDRHLVLTVLTRRPMK